MSEVKYVWEAYDDTTGRRVDQLILYIARVSNPSNQESTDTGLLRYCMKHGHVSPFEMASVCLEINTTRDIGRQILRHRSFSFQEFSQRYADVGALSTDIVTRDCRLQDVKNRQNSIETDDVELAGWWVNAQHEVHAKAQYEYRQALAKGIAKEQARALLPEGLTPSRMYMSGTIRSWIHYLQARLDPTTQAEHRVVAGQVLEILRGVAPITMEAFFGKEP